MRHHVVMCPELPILAMFIVIKLAGPVVHHKLEMIHPEASMSRTRVHKQAA